MLKTICTETYGKHMFIYIYLYAYIVTILLYKRSFFPHHNHERECVKLVVSCVMFGVRLTHPRSDV